VIRALATGRYDEVAGLLHPSVRGAWSAQSVEDALAPFFAEYERIIHDQRARQAHLCVIQPEAPRLWSVQQALLDDQDDNLWHLACEVDLRNESNPTEPLLQLRRISE
jgi:hypothetical protein